MCEAARVHCGVGRGCCAALDARRSNESRRPAEPLAAGDSAGQERVKTFLAAMRELGWIDGRNMRVELRWAPGGEEEVRKQAAELVALAPDVVIANGLPGSGRS